MWQLQIDSIGFFEKFFYSKYYTIEVKKTANPGCFDVVLCKTQFKIEKPGTFDITAAVVPVAGCEIDGSIAYKLLLKRNGNIICESSVFEMQVNNLCNSCLKDKIISLKAVSVDYSDFTEDRFKCAELVINPMPGIKIGDRDAKVTVKAKYGNNEYDCVLGETSDNNNATFLLDGEKRTLPVFVCKNGLPFPNPGDRIKIEASCSYETCKKQNVIEAVYAKYDFDPRYNHLCVEVLETDITGGEKKTRLENGKSAAYELQEVHLSDDGYVTKTVVIKNVATETIPGQIDRGIKIEDIKTLFTGDEKRITGKCSSDWSSTVANKELTVQHNSIEIPIKLDFNAIENIAVKDNCGYMLWSQKIEFTYEEPHYKEVSDEMGNKSVEIDDKKSIKENFSCNISFKLYRKPPKYWYSLDFGTSAIAVYKAWQNDNGEFKPDFVPLDVIKKRLLMENFAAKERHKLQDRKVPSPLIASSIYANSAYKKDVEVEGKGFKDEEIWLSPSTGMVTPSDQLPCLKNMIGHQYIPSIVDCQIGKMTVDRVFETAYKQLCNYYLKEYEIETLLLTVPNTFTPVQIEKIKEIVLSTIPTLREDKLTFVSESDAVLCSYVKKTIDDDQAKKERLYNVTGRQGEYVLVFDMGAGTLDISYALVSRNKDGKYKLDIKDRVGVNKAGNYIDYLLGEIICDLVLFLKDNNEEDPVYKKLRALISYDTNIVNYAMNNQFKDYLRNIVKPLLNKEASTILPAPEVNNNSPVWRLGGIDVDVFKDISMGDIVGHEKFKDFVRSCTSDIIDGIKRRNTVNKNLLKIDTVIISGRGASLNVIRDGLVEAVNNGNAVARNSDRRCYNITGGYSPFSMDDILINGHKESQDNITPLKTVVACGALDYMLFTQYNSDGFTITKRENYGSYGIIKIMATGQREWISFIDTNKGVQDYTQELPMNGVTAIHLCHTYSTTPAYDMDMTTVLDRYVLNAPVNRMAFNLSIRDNKVTYKAGNRILTINYHDDYSNENLRKSLWPIVYQN